MGYVLGEGPDAVLVSAEEAKTLRRLSVLAGFEKVWTRKAFTDLFRGLFGGGGGGNGAARRRQQQRRRKKTRRRRRKRRERQR